MDYLFRPNEHLEGAINSLYSSAGLTSFPGSHVMRPGIEGRDHKQRALEPYISIHYRTGDITWDPNRHNSTLSQFLRCAAKAEADLGLPPHTPWILHTDSLRTVPPEYYMKLTHEFGAHKKIILRNLEEEDTQGVTEMSAHDGNDDDLTQWTGSSFVNDAPKKLRVPSNGGRVHIDRSDFDDALSGYLGAYAEWYAISQARAAVLSRSFFGETAAEIGRLQDVFFVTGCVRMDLSSS